MGRGERGEEMNIRKGLLCSWDPIEKEEGSRKTRHVLVCELNETYRNSSGTSCPPPEGGPYGACCHLSWLLVGGEDTVCRSGLAVEVKAVKATGNERYM